MTRTTEAGGPGASSKRHGDHIGTEPLGIDSRRHAASSLGFEYPSGQLTADGETAINVAADHFIDRLMGRPHELMNLARTLGFQAPTGQLPVGAQETTQRQALNFVLRSVLHDNRVASRVVSELGIAPEKFKGV